MLTMRATPSKSASASNRPAFAAKGSPLNRVRAFRISCMAALLAEKLAFKALLGFSVLLSCSTRLTPICFIPKRMFNTLTGRSHVGRFHTLAGTKTTSPRFEAIIRNCPARSISISSDPRSVIESLGNETTKLKGGGGNVPSAIAHPFNEPCFRKRSSSLETT